MTSTRTGMTPRQLAASMAFMNLVNEARTLRRRQIFLLGAGVIGALAIPVSVLHEDLAGLALLPSLTGIFIVPLAYFLFAATIEKTVAQITTTSLGRLRWLAVISLVPVFGAIAEIVLLYKLARLTARLEGAADHSGTVLGLALGRIVVLWTLVVLVSMIFAVTGTSNFWTLAYAVGPLASFALLGVITQLVATPIFEQAVQPVEANLGAMGATRSMGSMAVPTQSVRPPVPPNDQAL